MRDFRELKVWCKAHELTLDVYRISLQFPRQEIYGLISQARRAAVSIEANIAEGAGKESRSDFARFLQIALGSASEVECHLLIARDLGYLPVKEHAAVSAKVVEVKKMLTGFLRYLHGNDKLTSRRGFPDG